MIVITGNISISKQTGVGNVGRLQLADSSLTIIRFDNISSYIPVLWPFSRYSVYNMLQTPVEMFKLTLTSHLCLTSLFFRDTKLNTKYIIVLLVSQWSFFYSCTDVPSTQLTVIQNCLVWTYSTVYISTLKIIRSCLYHLNICKKSGVLFMSLKSKKMSQHLNSRIFVCSPESPLLLSPFTILY